MSSRFLYFFHAYVEDVLPAFGRSQCTWRDAEISSVTFDAAQKNVLCCTAGYRHGLRPSNKEQRGGPVTNWKGPLATRLATGTNMICACAATSSSQACIGLLANTCPHHCTHELNWPLCTLILLLVNHYSWMFFAFQRPGDFAVRLLAPAVAGRQGSP